MKKNITICLILILLCSIISPAQAVKDSWSIGMGFSYPRFISSDVRPDEKNYGAFLSLQRNFSEDVALRLSGIYNHVTGFVPPGLYKYPDETPADGAGTFTTIFSGNIDLLYYLDPCSPASPYFGVGAGLVHYKSDWGSVVNSRVISKASPQFNVFFGTEWRLTGCLNLSTEMSLHSTSGEIDAVINNNRQGIFGSNSDAYISVTAGLQYYFSKGEPSGICDLYNGISINVPEENITTIEEIEDIVRRYARQPAEIDYKKIENIIKQYPDKEDTWILFGVNFETNKVNLSPESYPILDNAVELLASNTGLSVEIQGYADNLGSDEYNLALSEKRAQAVKEYLVSKGISSDRLTVIGYGKKNPAADNNTIGGRAKNRRVEFKITK
jgi:OOP family OmpA-OmpF porin